MNKSKLLSLSKLWVISIALFGSTVLLPTPAYAKLLQSAPGKITLLRLNEVNTKFGPRNDQIDVEVVIKLSSLPTNYFGFKLRKDTNQLVHQGMLDLLRDAYNNNHVVVIEYEICTATSTKPCKNGNIKRLWLTKMLPARSGARKVFIDR